MKVITKITTNNWYENLIICEINPSKIYEVLDSSISSVHYIGHRLIILSHKKNVFYVY